MKRFLSLPKELYQNKALIRQLALNDFKTRYAGSYLGIIWAFVQPVVTILVYWFVFDKLRAAAVGDMQTPFVLWLMAGMVPWFFFQDALMGGTSALIEYNYLVKKVVFKISVLPIVKILSALIVHVFFVTFMLIMYGCFAIAGKNPFPGISAIQILYYSFCVFALVLSISYLTSSVVVFFRDLSQIITIVLQIGVWMTPIMWSFDNLGIEDTVIGALLKLNPMYYIVMGYRDALIYGQWFFQYPRLTAYFWGLTLFFFLSGSILFKKLKVHFADVL